MKFVDTLVTFEEFPDEISLCINISNCPCHCKGCHSSYLADDIGVILNRESLFKLIERNRGITCIGLMGGDAAPNTISWLAKCVKEEYPTLKVGWYSGREQISRDIDTQYFDYIKIGPFIPEKGPLNSKTTNQRMYVFDHTSKYSSCNYMKDITYRFWEEKV